MKTHLYLLAALFGASALLQGCGNDDMPTPDVPVPAPDAARSATLTIGCVSNGALSRAATPFYELGFDNENTINDATILIYNKPINSSSVTDADKVVAAIYLNSDNLTASTDPSTLTPHYYDDGGNPQTIPNSHLIANKYTNVKGTTLSQKLNAALTNGQTYYAVAIANFGDQSAMAGMTLSDLRDYVYPEALYDTGYDNTDSSHNRLGFNGCGNFKMTGVNEVKFKWDNTAGTYDFPEPFMVQRLAARIDISFGNAGIATSLGDGMDAYATAYNGNFIFPIYDESVYNTDANTDGQPDKTLTRIEGAWFELTDIDLVNVVTQGQYLIEHASEDTHTYLYLGNENWSSAGVAQNLIASPDRTTDDAYYSIATIWSNLIQDYDTDGEFKTFSVLGYVGENTYTTDNSDNKYTGVKLTGKTNIESTHFNATDTEVDDNGYHSVTATFNVRHNINSTNALQYGIVRNTIYRMRVRFFANRDGLYVRWYWYNGTNNNLSDKEYKTNFNPFIIDNESAPTND